VNADAANQVRSFQRTLQAYARYNRQELGPLIESRAQRMRYELYRQFRAIAPTKDKIEQDVAGRGYAIRRRKGKDGRTLSVKQEIAARKRSIGWLGASWIFREWRRRRDGQSGNFRALSRGRAVIGASIVRTAKGERNPRVRLQSFLEGAMVQNRERSIVDKALAAQVADMRRYIARKQRERFQELLAATQPRG
jgi:hypothetical protein